MDTTAGLLPHGDFGDQPGECEYEGEQGEPLVAAPGQRADRRYAPGGSPQVACQRA